MMVGGNLKGNGWPGTSCVHKLVVYFTTSWPALDAISDEVIEH